MCSYVWVCWDCGWEGDIEECNIDEGYDKDRGGWFDFKACPKCGFEVDKCAAEKKE